MRDNMNESGKPNDLPNFRKGTILRARQLTDCVKYIQWLESRIVELERWRDQLGVPNVPQVVSLELTPKLLHYLPGVQVSYPYKIIATLSDGTTREVTSECILEVLDQLDKLAFEINAERRCLIPGKWGDGALQLRFGTVVKQERVQVLEFAKAAINPVPLFHTRDEPRILSRKAGHFPACSYDVAIGDELLASVFRGEDCGSQSMKQRMAEITVGGLGSGTGFRSFVLYVRCPPATDAYLEVSLSGNAQLMTPQALHISRRPGLVTVPKLIAFEGSVTQFDIVGPPIVAFQEIVI